MLATDSEVNVLGYYGYNNAGDEAFRLVFDRTFAGRRVTYHAPTGQLSVNSGPVVLGGGAVVNPFFLNALSDPPGLRVHLVGCSLPYGPKDCERLLPFGPRLGRLLLRSHADVRAAQEMGLPAEFVPDIVFSLDPADFRDEKVDPLEAMTALPPRRWGRHERTLTLCLSDDYHIPWSAEHQAKFEAREDFKTQIARACDSLAEKFNILFLPFSVWHNARDYLFAHDVARRMRNRDQALVVERVLSPGQLLRLIGTINGPVVSMKYHGLVFGMAAGRFCVNIGGTRKVIDLMNDTGLAGLSLPPARLTADKLVAAIEKHREERLLDTVDRVRTEWRGEARAKLADFAAAYLAEAAA